LQKKEIASSCLRDTRKDDHDGHCETAKAAETIFLNQTRKDDFRNLCT
jgi:hypothetical protein